MLKKSFLNSLTSTWLLVILGATSGLTGCSNNTPTPTPTPTTSNQNSPGSTQSSGGADSPLTVALEGDNRTDTDPLSLLENKQIKQELNITEEQTAKLKQVQQDFRQSVTSTASGIKWSELKPEEQKQKLSEVTKEIDVKSKESQKKVGEILTAEQTKRFKQILLQIFGWGVLIPNDFNTDLKITAEQQQKIDKLREDTVQKMRANWQAPKEANNRQQIIAANRKRMEQIVKESNQQALAILTPEQQKNLETLKGQEFKLDPSQLPQPAP